MQLVDLCTNPYILRVLYILVAVLKITCIIVPIIIIVTIILKAFQTVVSGKDDDLKVLLPVSVKKNNSRLSNILITNYNKFNNRFNRN